MPNSRLLPVVFAFSVVAGSAQAAIQDTVHRTFDVADGGNLTLDVDMGEVKILTGGTGVSVDIDRKARTSSQTEAAEIFKNLQLTFDQQGNDVTVRAKYPRTSHWFHSNNDLDLQYTVHVPS